MKIKLKIFLLFFLICFALIAAFSYYTSYFTRDSLRTKFFHRLEENALIVGNHTIENDAYLSQMYYEVKRNYLRQLSEGNDYILRVEKGLQDLQVKPQLPLPDDFYQKVLTSGKAEHMDKRIAYVGVFFRDSRHAKDLIVISSGEDDYGLAEQEALDKTMITGGTAAILFIALIAFLFAKHIIRPISTINNQIKRIGISNLSSRLSKEGHVNDEITVLVDSFNEMLGRLEIAVRSQKSFLGNASHSFRTPLTIIRGEAELALKKSAPGSEDYLALHRILEEADRMILIVNNLLRLSTMGMEEQYERNQRLRMDEMLFEVVGSEKSVSPESQIQIDMSSMPDDSDSLEILGNPNLIFIALSNVVSNACKYGGDNIVNVALGLKDHKICIEVHDRGIGIPHREQQYIYDSFFRGSNVGHIYGNGLGLLLAKNIIDLHRGEMFIYSREQKGTTVTILLPKET